MALILVLLVLGLVLLVFWLELWSPDWVLSLDLLVSRAGVVVLMVVRYGVNSSSISTSKWKFSDITIEVRVGWPGVVAEWVDWIGEMDDNGEFGDFGDFCEEEIPMISFASLIIDPLHVGTTVVCLIIDLVLSRLPKLGLGWEGCLWKRVRSRNNEKRLKKPLKLSLPPDVRYKISGVANG